MSSMVSNIVIATLILSPVTAVSAQAMDGVSDWQKTQKILSDPSKGNVSAALQRWKVLTGSDNYTFSEYASFLVTYPGWPQEKRMRRNAEQAINSDSYSPSQVLAYFDRFEPTTNVGAARYAVVLLGNGQREKAYEMARKAWRGGTLSESDERRVLGLFNSALTQDDHDQRMDALLWARARTTAGRQISLTSLQQRPIFAARLALQTKAANALQLSSNVVSIAQGNPGYIADRARYLRNRGNSFLARKMLAERPALSSRPANPEKWYEILLVNARAAANDKQWSLAYNIASNIDDAYDAGTDISTKSLGERDDYTSLAWLAGTAALNSMNRPRDAAKMFEKYALAARSPQTRSKGFYWAGKANKAAGEIDQANTFFQKSSAYADQFYGQLSLEQLKLDIPAYASAPLEAIAAEDRQKFRNIPLVRAAQMVAQTGNWRDQSRFYRALSSNAKNPTEHALIGELAKKWGRRDLSVISGRSAALKGYENFQSVAFPTMPVPFGYESKWSMIHAITRQESQFAQKAISHAGARGLMQLMRPTAREQAGKIGLSYKSASLLTDPQYNIRLGSSYFERMLDYYNRSYPLAVAAYNAGPGNVNKWLRRNGDPRTSQIDILDWIEQIPIYETKNYVQRVLENAVVYDSMHPDRARYKGSNKLSRYLGKTSPG